MTDQKQQNHKKRQQKLKEQVDSRIAAATTDKALLLVITGNGKGKSTAGFGTVARAVGHGLKAAVAQFIKGTWDCGERNLLEQHGVEFAVMNTGFTWDTQDREADIAAAELVWAKAEQFLQDDSIQLVLLDERELGVCVADIGVGTIDLMVISEGAPAWMQVMPMGGELLTHDLAVALKTPLGDAEHLKVQYGYAHTSFAPPTDTVQVKKLADRPAETISLQQLTAFLQPRVEEIAEILGERLRQSGRFEEASTGIVLCGGTAALPGIAQVFESLLQCPCRVLKQAHQEGLDGLLQDPANAVLAGLLAYGRDQEVRPKPRWLGAQGSMLNRVRQWIQGNF